MFCSETVSILHTRVCTWIYVFSARILVVLVWFGRELRSNLSYCLSLCFHLAELFLFLISLIIRCVGAFVVGRSADP